MHLKKLIDGFNQRQPLQIGEHLEELVLQFFNPKMLLRVLFAVTALICVVTNVAVVAYWSS